MVALEERDMRSFALILLLLCSPAIARDNNPFSGATSITVTMTRVVHHRRHHAVHQVYRAPVAWVPGFWGWRAVQLSPDEQRAMRGWR
jgi:hypothetical protein